MDDAAIMMKVKRGWMKFGEDDPWFVVHSQPEKVMGRYNSDSCLYHKGTWDS